MMEVDGASAWAIDETEDAEDAEAFRLLVVVSLSAGSNTGVGGAELTEELSPVESSDASASSTSDLAAQKTPPWIGGMKLVHRPSIRPMINLVMNVFASSEWRALISSVASLPTIC